MKKRFSIIFLLLVISVHSQITGNLKKLANQEVTLYGFNDFKFEILSNTTIDNLGNFTIIYPKAYQGIGVLKAKDNSSLVFVLTEPNIKINGTDLKEKENLVFINSTENDQFVEFAKRNSQRQSAVSAWNYLKEKYQKEPLFKNQKKVLLTIKAELNRIEKEESNSLKNLDKESYISWYLPFRKLVSDMPNSVRNNTVEIPNNIASFRNIDFNNPKFKTSGLLKDLIEGHYMLLENMGQNQDTIVEQMNRSTTYLMTNLANNKTLLNEVGSNLFDYLEKRSLFSSSEYLAVQLLSQNSCSLDEILTHKLEGYRKLKQGKIAPDIIFTDGKKLSDIQSNKLLIFGASWCSKCKEESVKLNDYYSSWKEKGFEVIYVSIDTDKVAFENAYKNKPWKTDCNFMGWDNQAIKDYHIFATPTYFLLDKDLKIILRPNSIEQTNSWLNSKFMDN
jgi:thiol-disulfide isomerase/thioredoxin